MNKTAKIILGIAAFTGVIAASAIAIMKAMKEQDGEGKKWGIIGGDDCDTRSRFLDIARLFNRDIAGVERRTSETIHKAKQKKYDSMDWDQEPITRCDAMN